jgi:hypothetical protein
LKAILLTTVFAVALNGQAIAEDLPAVAEIATNSLSHEMTQCFVFHNVVAACLLRGNDKKTAEQASKSAGVNSLGKPLPLPDHRLDRLRRKRTATDVYMPELGEFRSNRPQGFPLASLGIAPAQLLY